ncbi:MAG: hypothetical protein LBS69_00565 [Prevotellaceae bacterium]|jgi:hypothetical protein|nr:hypothetical protein [Prevotellaceae bacterium]
MHKFYITNNLGGGGTNVSRFVDYKQLFDLQNIGLLLNYYYLSGKVKIKFDTTLLKELEKFDNIAEFLNYAKKWFADNRSVSASFKQNLKPTNINGYMLDNGCGNILRDLLQSGKYTTKAVRNLVEPFHDFSESLNFDFSIALDYATKYTYKDNENADSQMKKLWQELAGNEKINLSLIDTTLSVKKLKNYNHKIYAPLHGFDYDSFEDYLNAVIKAEKQQKTKFDGFALGGIADSKKLPNAIWNVPKGITKELKIGYIVSKLCQKVCKIIDRPLHVLGAGNIYVFPFIINSGATSSDCHSAWRRASDGGFDKAKILVPLLNDKLEFINSKYTLKYVHIKNINNSYAFDCGYTISTLKKLYKSISKEDFYFGEILAFYQAVKQYDLLIRFTEKYPDYLNRLCKTPDSELNESYCKLIEKLKL